MAGMFGIPDYPNNAAAFLGVVGFTYSCANALMRYGVTANALAPVASDTRLMALVMAQREGQNRPVVMSEESRKVLVASNVAPAVAYVASVESGWMTGQVFEAAGRHISLFNRPSRRCEIVTTSDQWKLDDVFDLFESAFRPAVEGTENGWETEARREIDEGSSNG